MNETATNKISNIPRGLILLAVSLCTMLYAITLTIVNVVLPQMQGALSATPDQISWVVTLNVIATAVATPITGWMVARWGHRNVLIWSIIGFSLFSALCALADSLVALLIYRVGQGAFGAPLVPLAQAIIVAVYPPERRAFAQGIFGIAVVIGPAIAPALGGFLAEEYNWRFVFLLILPPFPPASPTQSSVQPPTSTPKASPQLVLPPFPSTSPSQQPPDNTSSSSPQPVPISIDHSYVQSASTRQYSDQEAFDRVLLLAANAGLAKLFSYQSKYAEGQRSSEDLEEQQFFRLYSQLMLRFQTPPPTNPPPTPAPSFQNLSLPARAPTVRQRKLNLMPPKLLNCPAFKDFKLDSKKKQDVKDAKKERTQAKKQEKIRNEIIKSFIEENETVPKRTAAKKTVKKADESVEVHFGEGVKKRRKTGDAACEGCEGKKRFRDWVSCETCSRWFHLSVFSTKDNTLKGKSVKDLKDVAWMCKSCC